MSNICTKFEFVLPDGYVDKDGNVHREGVMRRATAADEILPLKEASVQANPAYLTIILMSRVICELGTLEFITPKVIEGLFTTDMAYLQDFYNRINSQGSPTQHLKCPHCEKQFDYTPERPGELLATP